MNNVIVSQCNVNDFFGLLMNKRKGLESLDIIEIEKTKFIINQFLPIIFDEPKYIIFHNILEYLNNKLLLDLENKLNKQMNINHRQISTVIDIIETLNTTWKNHSKNKDKLHDVLQNLLSRIDKTKSSKIL